MRTGEESNFGDDFLVLLLKAHHDADVGQRITIEEVINECKTLYFGGQDTTTSSLHTDWQDEARKYLANKTSQIMMALPNSKH